MTGEAADRWREADRLFDEALELPQADRARLLDQRCRDDLALRQQVEALLQLAFPEGDIIIHQDPLSLGDEGAGNSTPSSRISALGTATRD